MSSPDLVRPEFHHIAAQVAPHSHVLDLGCGDGALLAMLAVARHTTGYGVDLDDANVAAALQQGVNVIQSDLESGLSTFASHSFDYVLLSHTIQSIHNVEGILVEMARVGRECIVSVPNFGFWENRRQVMMGKMPVSRQIPYAWYNTPNIHLCTLNDFAALLAKLGFQTLEERVLHQGKAIRWGRNWRGSVAMFRFKGQ